MQASREAV